MCLEAHALVGDALVRRLKAKKSGEVQGLFVIKFAVLLLSQNDYDSLLQFSAVVMQT